MTIGKNQIMFLMYKSNKEMDCRNYTDRIDDYLEGKLFKDDRFAFENHLDSCAKCRESVELQRLAERIISQEKNSVSHPYLSGRIMSAIENSGKKADSAIIRILRPVAVTISVAAAIFAGILIGNIPEKAVKVTPLELTLINDESMESVNVLSQE